MNNTLIRHCREAASSFATKWRSSFVIAAALCALAQGAAAADVSFAYQGVLRAEDGGALPERNQTVEFRLYDSPDGESALWGRTVAVLLDENGLFNAELSDSAGSTAPGAPGTGLPATGSKNGKGSGSFIDESTKRKQGMNDTVSLCVKSFYGKDRYRKGDKEYRELYDRVPFDVSGICGKNDWIAVIHADGNSLGQVVRHVGHDRDKFSEFSRELDKATILSANEAFEHLCRTRHIDEGGGLIPIRPIVLGGDDMTVIIRGDLAIGYVTEYMRKFQENTRNGRIGEIIRDATEKDEPAKRMTRLTACAGVAFIKSSFPFYYGYRLAESLCDAAKKRAKEIDKVNVPACLMFHKVQDSFIESYADITERELTPQEGLSLQYGPYYLDEGKAPLGFGTVGSLLESVSKLRDGGDDIRPAVRRWLTVLHESRAKADQFLSRAKAIHPGQKALIGRLTEFIKRKDSEACPAYDVLALNTIMSQVTREESHED